MSDAVKIRATCPVCGNSTWYRRDDGFECAACGEFCYTEDMCVQVDEQPTNTDSTPECQRKGQDSGEMREILFRGQRLDNKKWTYGDLLQFQDSAVIHTYENGCRVSHQIDETTTGQYTGRLGKGRKKIFEGDIVRISLPIAGCKPIVHLSEVYFDDGCFCVNWGGTFRPHHRTRIDSFVPDTIFEVVGNIYDNPELLEAETDGH